jgi:hypothetical protein
MTGVDASTAPEPLDAEAIMDGVRRQVRAELRARLVAHGADDEFTDPRVFDEVDGLFRRTLARDDRARLLLPDLFDEPWAPDLALRFTSHRPGPVGSSILFVKRRLLQPLMRWLFEYSLENFRKQDRVNVALMACLQSLAADHVKLRLRVAALEGRLGLVQQDGAPGAGPANR